MNEQAPVNVSVQGSVGVLQLNRPDKFNCLSPASHAALLEGLARFAKDTSVRSILVCSTGKHFCTGADLDSVREARAQPEGLARFIQAGHEATRALEQSTVPTIVAVQGLCLAGGLELMMACDVAFASLDSKFGDQHAEFGLVPGWGGSQRLTRIVGRRRAMDMYYSARKVDATTAMDWGLVNYLCAADELYQAALGYCERLGTRSRAGLAAMKRLALEGLDLPLPSGLALEEGVALRALLGEDANEGLQAFEARRAPNFSA